MSKRKRKAKQPDLIEQFKSNAQRLQEQMSKKRDELRALLEEYREILETVESAIDEMSGVI